jgi:hypothetical protein
MFLPALKNSASRLIPASQTVEELVRASTQNLQRLAAEVPGGGAHGAVYLGFDGINGIWKLNKEEVDTKAVGRLLVPYFGLYEGMVEWASGSPLQKIQRQLLGVSYDEPMSERLLPKPLSPNAYRKENDGPKYMVGFVGTMLDEGGNVVFEHTSSGGKKAIEALATTAVQALVAFGEMVHPVITLDSTSYESAYRTIYNPIFSTIGYVTDATAREVDVISDKDILTRPAPSKAKLARRASEAPAI